MLARALWRFLRFPLILLAFLLGLDLLAAVVIVPPMLLGPAGIPITVALLTIGGYAARKIVAARRSVEERRRRLEQKWAERRRQERQWSRKLQWLELNRPEARIDYLEAASEFGWYGYAAGLCIGSMAAITAFHGWPDLVKSLPLPVVIGAPLALGLLGFVAVVLYRVHLHHRVRPRVEAWRRRRLRRRLARSVAGRREITGDAAMAHRSWDDDLFNDDAGDPGDFSDTGGSDSDSDSDSGD